MGVKRAVIAAIEEKARRAPPAPASEADVSKQEAVKLLFGAIAEFRRKGYSLEQIAENFRGEGLELTTPTLKSYLSRVKASKQRRRALPRHAAAVTNVQPVSTEKEAPAKSGKDAFLVKDKDSY